MTKRFIKPLIVFFLILILGMVYVAVFGDNIALLTFANDNSNIIHTILFSTASICAVLIYCARKE